VYLGALKYVPHAVLKLLENMPMPWEQVGPPRPRPLLRRRCAPLLVEEVLQCTVVLERLLAGGCLATPGAGSGGAERRRGWRSDGWGGARRCGT
jgi:hypothetical protein